MAKKPKDAPRVKTFRPQEDLYDDAISVAQNIGSTTTKVLRYWLRLGQKQDPQLNKAVLP